LRRLAAPSAPYLSNNALHLQNQHDVRYVVPQLPQP
jgi:hypothetical protein